MFPLLVRKIRESRRENARLKTMKIVDRADFSNY